MVELSKIDKVSSPRKISKRRRPRKSEFLRRAEKEALRGGRASSKSPGVLKLLEELAELNIELVALLAHLDDAPKDVELRVLEEMIDVQALLGFYIGHTYAKPTIEKIQQAIHHKINEHARKRREWRAALREQSER